MQKGVSLIFPSQTVWRYAWSWHCHGIWNENVASTSKANIIDELKVTCKRLNDNIKNYTGRKRKLERLIEAMTEDGGEENYADEVDVNQE